MERLTTNQMENLRTAYELLQDLLDRVKDLPVKDTVSHISTRDDGAVVFLTSAADGFEFYTRIEGLLTRDPEDVVDEANAAVIRVSGKITEYLATEDERKARRIAALQAEIAQLEGRA